MQAKFFCKTGALAGSEYGIGEDATIGRAPENEIVLASDLVSTSHARIAFDATADAYFLEDLESRNGTRLDGVPVSGRTRLGDLHVVTIAAHDFLFVLLPDDAPVSGAADGDDPASARPTAGATRYEVPSALAAPALGPNADVRSAARDAAPPALAAAASGENTAPEPATRHEAPSALAAPVLEVGGAGAAAVPDAAPATQVAAAATVGRAPAPAPSAGVALEIRLPDAAPRRVTLRDGRHVLGRATDCSVPVDDRTLSRRHAAFLVRGERLTVTDLESLNGTYLGERAIEKATEIGVGQTVTLGERVAVVRVRPAGARRPATEE